MELANDQTNEENLHLFKKVGLNFRIKDRTVFFKPRGTWQILSNSALSASPAGEVIAPQVRKTSENSEIVNWRKREDSNLRCLSAYRFSRAARSTTLVRFHKNILAYYFPSVIMAIYENNQRIYF